MIRIVGIDPGSRLTGWGIIDMDGNHARHVSSGHLAIKADNLPQRLQLIFQGISDIVTEYEPQELAIERVFVHRNADSALKLGHARGAAICAAMLHALEVAEYSPTQIKQATVGKGNAAKPQVQHMVKILLNLKQMPQEDEADALAAAICHGHTRGTLARMALGRHSVRSV